MQKNQYLLAFCQLFKGTIPYLLLIAMVIVAACKSGVEIDNPSTELHIKIKDEQNKPLSSKVIIALFANRQIYESSSARFSTQNAAYIDSTSDENGVYIFKNIESGRKYHIAAYYRDSTRFKGFDIYHDNALTGVDLKDTIQRGAITYASIRVTPAEGLLAFYAQAGVQESLPIRIQLNSDTIGMISQTRLSAPTSAALSESNVKYIKARRGINTYTFNSITNCSTIDSVKVDGGSFKSLNINSCVSGWVTFYTGERNKDKPIDITINSNIKLPILKDRFLAQKPMSCTDINTLHYSLSPGIHTYVATTPGRNATITGCAWQGSFTITGNGCNGNNIIRLEDCNQ